MPFPRARLILASREHDRPPDGGAYRGERARGQGIRPTGRGEIARAALYAMNRLTGEADKGAVRGGGAGMAYRLKQALVPVLAILAVAADQGRADASQVAGAETINPSDEEGAQWGASVVRVDPLLDQGDLTVKLFGAAGGDPAMNGLYTYLAFFHSPAEGWHVFRIGDFLEYRIVSETAGRVALEVDESVMNQASGEIGSRTRRIALSWTPGPDGAPPVTITATNVR